MRILLATTLLIATLPAAVQAAGPIDEAARELRKELAQARQELRTGDLSLGQGVSFGKRSVSGDDDDLPEAVITPEGQLRIEGRTVATNAAQRALLLDYRRQVIEVAEAGIDVGERAGRLALQAIDAPLLSLLASAMTGSLERKVEQTIRKELAPLAGAVCDRLPPVLASQQRLAGSLPEFRPYARLQASDIQSCHKELTESLAQR